MFKAFTAWLQLFRVGKIAANPEAWKKGQITVGILVSILTAALAVAKGYGYDLPMSNEDLVTVASFILFVIGLFDITATTVSTKKVGLPAKDEPEPESELNPYNGLK